MKKARASLAVWAILGVLGCWVVPMAHAQTDATTQTTTTGEYDERNGPDLGWIGLLGLAGLMGLRRRPAQHHEELREGRTARA
jgi:MYXO-CTERM domain-containing protein